MDLSNMQTVRSYEDCDRVFQAMSDGKQRVNWDSARRPLDGWGKPHVCLEKEPPGLIHCRLYETNMVSYVNDGAVYLRFDSRQGSQQFMRHVLPPGVRWVKRGMPYYWEIDTTDGAIYIATRSQICLQPVSVGVWELISDAQLRHRLTVNWARARKVQKRLEEIKDSI